MKKSLHFIQNVARNLKLKFGWRVKCNCVGFEGDGVEIMDVGFNY